MNTPQSHKTQKGHKGFLPRPVVVLNPDGSIFRRFPSVGATQNFFHLKRRSSVSSACQGKSFCRGYRMLYAEDYIPAADYHYTRRRFRDDHGHLLPGHQLALLRKEPSEETKRQKSLRAAEIARRLAQNPSSRWGKGSPLKPVRCIETGEEFPSITAAADKLGASAAYLSFSIARGRKCHGLTFKKITTNNPNK